MQQMQAVIFDLFGTLVDYLPAEEYDRAFRAVAGALELPYAEFRAIWSATLLERDSGKFSSVEGAFQHVCRQLGRTPTPAQIEEAVRIRLAIYRRNLVPRDGAVELFGHLRSRGLRIGLVSNCSHEIPRIWSETAFHPFIEEPVFSPEAGTSKPDARIYRLACDRLGIAPERCLYIGDGSSHELAGAQRVGMTSVLICTPYERESVMQKEEPCEWQGPIIEHLAEVIQILDFGF